MEMSSLLNESVYTLKRSAIREFSALAARVPDCVKLTLGEPDFNTPSNISAAAIDSINNGDTHYIQNNGSRALLEKIAEYEKDNNNLDYKPEEIIVTAGATEALYVSLLGILNPGDEVIIPTPAFLLYQEIVHFCRAKSISMDTTADGFQIRSDNLLPLITDKTKVIILNSPNNPTGAVYDDESLKAVYDAVKDRGIFVICDDVYRHLCYGKEYHSFAEFTELKNQIIVVQSFSKPYAMTGWRMGYMMADYPVKEHLELVHQYDIVSTPAMFQAAAIEALGTDTSEMVKEYEIRRDYVLGRLAGMDLEISNPEGAFYVFPSIARFGMGSMEFAKELLTESAVAVTPGVAFGSDDHIRISYCCSREQLQDGMDRLEAFVRSFDK